MEFFLNHPKAFIEPPLSVFVQAHAESRFAYQDSLYDFVPSRVLDQDQNSQTSERDDNGSVARPNLLL